MAEPRPVASEEIPHPNDKLFSAAFAVPENAAGLLQAKLPSAVAAAIDWSLLRLRPGSFVDSQFKRSHTDLLFVAPLAGTDTLIYVLFEHQSTFDRISFCATCLAATLTKRASRRRFSN